MSADDYLIEVHSSLAQVDGVLWNELLQLQDAPTPFMRHEYLCSLQDSESAVARTGWALQVITLRQGPRLCAACALYVKSHSYGEYVFDWSWAEAYQRHGLDYYPKAVIAVPFTPVPGSRLLARNDRDRQALLEAALAHCRQLGLSSLHLLFGSPDDLRAAESAGMMQRQTVQFHWQRQSADGQTPARDFDDFLGRLNQEKRKKIRQERRKVADSGVRFQVLQGPDITESDWDFFYRCYERTYLEHGHQPYLRRAFFQLQAQLQPASWLMFVALRQDRPIASSLIGLQVAQQPSGGAPRRTAYGRYWGALERVDCLHFEACYYQPLAWCISNGYDSFEGGAQGEHKMARALLPVATHSAHWLAHPAFADAVQQFLEREDQGLDRYLEDLQGRSPYRRGGPPGEGR